MRRMRRALSGSIPTVRAVSGVSAYSSSAHCSNNVAPVLGGFLTRTGVLTLELLEAPELRRWGDAMSQHKKAVTDVRIVWRMTDGDPLGELLTLPPGGSPAAKEAPVAEPGDALQRKSVRYWRASSHDLATGLDVKDFSDTVPSEFLE